MSCSQPCHLLSDVLQDDLAEHTMHSPVWQDYDPSFDTAEIWSDWEYYSDDYYDVDSPRKKRKINDQGHGTNQENDCGSGLKRRRRKLRATDEIPEMSLEDPLHSDLDGLRQLAPVIIWRSKTEEDHIPVVSEGQEEKIALLKDWREKFKVPFQPKSNLSQREGVARRDSRKALAVVIEQKPAGKSTKGKERVKDSLQNPGIPSRLKVAQTRTSGTTITASSTAKQRQKVSETLKPANATKIAQKSSDKPAISTHPGNKAPNNGLKRKASNLTEDKAGSGLVNGGFKDLNRLTEVTKTTHENGFPHEALSESATSKRPKKLARPKADTCLSYLKSKEIGPIQEETPTDSTASEGAKKRGRPKKIDTPVPRVTEREGMQNTKFWATKDTDFEIFPNGKTSTRGAATASANIAKKAQLEASTGSLRKQNAPNLLSGDGGPFSKLKAPDLQNRDTRPRLKRRAPDLRNGDAGPLLKRKAVDLQNEDDEPAAKRNTSRPRG